VLRESLASYGLSDIQIVELAIGQEQIIAASAITHWVRSRSLKTFYGQAALSQSKCISVLIRTHSR
jgi:hypothetical protein